MRLISSAGNIDRPSPAQIADALRAIDHNDDNPYLILSSGNGAFIQTIKKSARRFFLEHREGTNGPHWSTGLIGHSDVERVFLSYLAQETNFKADLEWQDVTAAIESDRRDKLVSVAWHVHVLARAVIALNRGTAAMLDDAELLVWMSKAQQKRLQLLTDSLEVSAREISRFADRIASSDKRNAGNVRRQPRRKV